MSAKILTEKDSLSSTESEPINDGGSAFPKAALDPWGKSVQVNSGMTLRDYFAAKAMAQLIAYKERLLENNPECSALDVEKAVAAAAYLQADAMLAEREKGKQP